MSELEDEISYQGLENILLTKKGKMGHFQRNNRTKIGFKRIRNQWTESEVTKCYKETKGNRNKIERTRKRSHRTKIEIKASPLPTKIIQTSQNASPLTILQTSHLRQTIQTIHYSLEE